MLIIFENQFEEIIPSIAFYVSLNFQKVTVRFYIISFTIELDGKGVNNNNNRTAGYISNQIITDRTNINIY